MSGSRRIIVGVNGSPTSLQALRYAAGRVHDHDAILIPVLAWVPPGGDLADRRAPSAILRHVWEDAAWQRLWDALDAAFGGLPDGLPVEPLVQCGRPGRVLVGVARQAGDLLVIGAGRRGSLSRLLHCPVSRYCLGHARCPVLAIPPPALAQEAGHGLHGWAFRHRGLDPDKASLPGGQH